LKRNLFVKKAAGAALSVRLAFSALVGLGKEIEVAWPVRQ
jgi:hypothetical protein